MTSLLAQALNTRYAYDGKDDEDEKDDDVEYEACAERTLKYLSCARANATKMIGLAPAALGGAGGGHGSLSHHDVIPDSPNVIPDSPDVIVEMTSQGC